MIIYLNTVLLILVFAILLIVRKRLIKISYHIWLRSIILVSLILLLCVVNIISVGTLSPAKVASNQDILIVLDLTQSMNANDGRNGGDNTRLDNAKEDIKTIVKNNPGAAFAIMGFNSKARLMLPLSTNSRDVVEATDTLNIQTGSNALPGVVKYTEVFDNVGNYLKEQSNLDPTRERLVILMSDFETYRNQETQDEIVKNVAKINKHSGGILNIVYGKDEGAKILKFNYNYETASYLPYYKTSTAIALNSKYVQDPRNKYQEILSKPDFELATRISKNSTIRYTDMEKFNSIFNKLEKSSRQKTATNPQTQSIRQNWVYSPLSILIFIWIVLSEILKPAWIGRVLSRNKEGKD